MADDLYFAYGSNLNEEDLRDWCNREGHGYPFIGEVTDAFLPDHEYVFNVHSNARGGRVLNLRSRVAQAVHGVVFHLREGAWETLDRKEGAPEFYERRRTTVFDRYGEPIEVQTYTVPTERTFAEPIPAEPRYLEIVLKGLDAHQPLGTEQLSAAARWDAVPLITDRLFVYGTLMTGEPMELRIQPDEDVLSWQSAEAPGLLYEVSGLPCLQPSRNHMVQGECIRHRNLEQLFLDLDAYEGFRGYSSLDRSLYYRAILFCRTQDGEHPAWAYFGTRNEGGRVVETGDWRKR